MFNFNKGTKARTRLLNMILCGVFWGILAHGMALFNKYCYHDDAPFFNRVGVTWRSGRWMLGLLEGLFRGIMDDRFYSLSAFKGLLTFVLIAIMLYMVFDFLEIKDPVMIVLVIGMAISFPSIAGVFGFMFTAPYYYFGALMGACGACLYFKFGNIPAMLGGMLLIACSVGVYQVNLTISVCIVLLLLIHTVYHSEKRLAGMIIDCVKALALLVGALVLYFLLNQLFLYLNHTTLTDYKGISSFGTTGIMGYLGRIFSAYGVFFFPARDLGGNMYPFSSRYVHAALVVIFCILAVLFLVKVFRKNVEKGIVLAALFVIFPLGAYLIYVMVDAEFITGLMTYAEVFTFVLAAWILENLVFEHKAVFWLKRISVVLIAILLALTMRFDHLCYTKAEFLQTQAISYYTTLISRITSTEGYTTETPVVYINQRRKKTSRISDTKFKFEPIKMVPYEVDTLINDYQWRTSMAMWCGFIPYTEDEKAFKEMTVVKAMPCYPDEGSIRFIDGCIVVKFAD